VLRGLVCDYDRGGHRSGQEMPHHFQHSASAETPIDEGKLRARSVRGRGSRGRHFELDRMNPDGGYVRDNCTLCCYH
jgi:predicted DNA-binding WGR domain protein